jgi:hypothetical protein
MKRNGFWELWLGEDGPESLIQAYHGDQTRKVVLERQSCRLEFLELSMVLIHFVLGLRSLD